MIYCLLLCYSILLLDNGKVRLPFVMLNYTLNIFTLSLKSEKSTIKTSDIDYIDHISIENHSITGDKGEIFEYFSQNI